MSHSFSSKRFSADRIAIFLSFLGVIFSAIVADRVYERLAHLEDDWSMLFLGGFHDGLDLLHIVGVKGAHGKMPFQGRSEHLLTGH